MHVRHYLMWFITAVLVIVLKTASDAKVYIDINAPSFRQFPIAIEPFAGKGTPADIDSISVTFSGRLSSALEMTGFFRLISGSTGTVNTQNADDLEKWFQAGADFLVNGSFDVTGSTLSAEFRLFDVVEERLIAGKKYWGRKTDADMMVRKFASEILRALTGEGGVFDTKIAFSGKIGGRSEIYTVNFDGSEFRSVTQMGALTLLPHWSPDGKYLSFTSYKTGNPDGYLLNAETGRTEKIAGFPGLNLAGPWSPDGKRMLLVLSKDGNEEIYEMDRAGKTLRRLTRDAAIDVSPAWSPDGRKIAFVSNRSGSPQIFVMDADGGNVRRLTYEGSYNTSPAWSPVGNTVAYEGMTHGIFQLFLISGDGGDFRQLTFEGGNCESPAWSPDGRYIAFSMKKGAASQLAVINANGTNLRVLSQLDRTMSYDDPSWSPHILY